RDLELEPETTAFEAERLDSLAQGRRLGRVDEQDGVDEIDPTATRLDRSAGGGRRVTDPLAFDISELAPLGCDAIRRPHLAESDGHERHRFAACQRPDAHRDR